VYKPKLPTEVKSEQIMTAKIITNINIIAAAVEDSIGTIKFNIAF